MQLKLNQIINLLTGLSGVAADENMKARRWARRFELPMILLAIWMLIEWYLRGKNIYSPVYAQATDWFIWLFFFSETVVITSQVDDKRRYLRSNWMNLFIIIVAFPFLWVGSNYVAILRTLRVTADLPDVAECFSDGTKSSGEKLSRFCVCCWRWFSPLCPG